MTLLKDETLAGIAFRRFDSQRVPQTRMNSEGKRGVLLSLGENIKGHQKGDLQVR